MGFTKLELEAFRDQPVDDLVGPGVRLLFVGINPGLWTAATNTHFARPGNRFYPALYLAGITDRLLDPSAGLDHSGPSASRGQGGGGHQSGQPGDRAGRRTIGRRASGGGGVLGRISWRRGSHEWRRCSG